MARNAELCPPEDTKAKRSLKSYLKRIWQFDLRLEIGVDHRTPAGNCHKRRSGLRF